MLTDRDLIERIKNEEIKMEPIDLDKQIQPASIDLRLGDEFRKVNSNTESIVTFDSNPEYKLIKGDKIILPPLSFILATTMEYMEIPANIGGLIVGRSSIGRLTLQTENAGWVDPGYKGEITLELFNAGEVPIELQAGRRVCQIVLFETTKEAKNPYNGKYVNQKGPTSSKISEDVV